MTKELLNEIENDYWNEKADPIDMAEVFDLAIKALEQEPCDDCISRKSVIDVLTKHRVHFVDMVAITSDLKDLPSVQPKAKAGKWIHRNDDLNDWLECSNCGYGSEGEVKYGEGTPYCPVCGCQMMEEKI